MKIIVNIIICLFLLAACNQPLNTNKATTLVTDTATKPKQVADSADVPQISKPIAPCFISSEDEIMSSYPQGEKKLKDYIYQHKKKMDKKYHTFVRVRFDVDTTGTLSNFSIDYPIDDCLTCNQDALQLAKQMPNWIPAYRLNEKGQKERPFISANVIQVYY